MEKIEKIDLTKLMFSIIASDNEKMLYSSILK